MKIVINCRMGITCAMIFLQVLLLVGCAAKKDTATPLPTNNVTMQSKSPDMPSPDETLSQERQLLVESDYDVSSNSLVLRDLKISSFDFLNEYKNLRELTITDCTLPGNLALPQTDTLEYLYISGIDGQNVLDFINASSPFPNLSYLFVSNENAKYETALNEIPSLSHLLVVTENPINVSINNSQVKKLLIATDGYGRGDIQSLDGLEEFKNLKSLTVRAQFNDLSALSGCCNLEDLVISYTPNIKTLKPLFGLQKLENIEMTYQAYLKLPQEDRDYFNFGNDNELGTAHIFCR